MLSTELERTRMRLHELADCVTPQQWALIRSCIQDLGTASQKVRHLEEILLPGDQKQWGCQHG